MSRMKLAALIAAGLVAGFVLGSFGVAGAGAEQAVSTPVAAQSPCGMGAYPGAAFDTAGACAQQAACGSAADCGQQAACGSAGGCAQQAACGSAGGCAQQAPCGSAGDCAQQAANGACGSCPSADAAQ